MALRPFRIEFTGRAIADLHQRLDATRWPPPLPEEARFDASLRLLARDWVKLDWPAWQARLNRLAHLRGVVEGGEVHAAVLGRPWGTRRATVLLLHAAAGTFFDRLPLAERLCAAGCDVVLASLPGTGYSERLAGPATPEDAARRLRGLMRALGYDSYLVHGDGYGARVAAALAGLSGGAAHDLALAPPTTDGALPAVLAYALGDSPVGMLAWWLAARGEPAEAAREPWLAAATWCWLTASAAVAAGLGGDGVPALPDGVIEAAVRTQTGAGRGVTG